MRKRAQFRIVTDTFGLTPTMRRSPQRKGAARGAGAAWGLACVLLFPVHCAAYCKLSDASVCWGNTYRFREVAGGPFDGINVGDDSAPVLADIDGDGDLDLVVGNRDGVLNYFENTGTSTTPLFVRRTGSANPFDGINVGNESAPALADLDDDGDLDLVVGDEGSLLNYFNNTGNSTAPTFVARTGSANPFNEINVGRDGSPAFVDLDGDHDLDLVVGESIHGVLIYLENAGNSTTPVFAQKSGSANPFDGIDVGYWTTPALADIDGDGTLSVSIIDRLRRHIFLSLAGDLDLVVGEEYGQLIYFNNTGNYTTPLFVQRTGGANPFDGIDVGDKSAPTFADLDDDGTVDLVVGVGGYGAESGKIFYYRNVGTPSRPNFEKVDEESPFDQIDLGEDSKPALTDVDGDGTLRPCPYQQRRRITRFCRRRSGPRSWRRRQLAQLLREHRDIYNASI